MPAMVACVEDRNGRLVGIHRTWLSLAGSKANIDPVKAALGPIGGGAVRLASTLGERVVLAEGIETALSVFQATAIPTWAVLSTSGLRIVRLPSAICNVIIAADGDEPGEAAARHAATRLMREGRLVRIMRPESGRDFNDYLNE
jgi:putative DNA primase/helicase